MDYKSGDRVRFTRGPLGLVKGDTPLGKFEPETVESGDTGVVVDLPENHAALPEGWIAVAPDKHWGTELYAPVHPWMLDYEVEKARAS
jgi:hypothetical protein